MYAAATTAAVQTAAESYLATIHLAQDATVYCFRGLSGTRAVSVMGTVQRVLDAMAWLAAQSAMTHVVSVEGITLRLICVVYATATMAA